MPNEPAHVVVADGLGLGRGVQAPAQGEAACHGEADERGEGHDAESAELDHQQDHDLAETGPEGGGVENVARHADGRCCREQRIDETGPFTGPGRDRKAQQYGADKVGDSEAEDDGLSRVQAGRAARPRDSRRGASGHGQRL